VTKIRASQKESLEGKTLRSAGHNGSESKGASKIGKEGLAGAQAIFCSAHPIESSGLDYNLESHT
jgi:hypothetical protein